MGSAVHRGSGHCGCRQTSYWRDQTISSRWLHEGHLAVTQKPHGAVLDVGRLAGQVQVTHVV